MNVGIERLPIRAARLGNAPYFPDAIANSRLAWQSHMSKFAIKRWKIIRHLSYFHLSALAMIYISTFLPHFFHICLL